MCKHLAVARSFVLCWQCCLCPLLVLCPRKKDEIAQVIASPVDKPYLCKICGQNQSRTPTNNNTLQNNSILGNRNICGGQCLWIYGYNLSWAIDIGRCASIWLLHDLLYDVDSVVCVLYLCYEKSKAEIEDCSKDNHRLKSYFLKLEAQVKELENSNRIQLLTLADVQAFGCCTIFCMMLTVLSVSFTCVMSSFPLWSIPSSKIAIAALLLLWIGLSMSEM
jgi:hypothetical protein